MSKKIGVLGTGTVGQTLANGLKSLGHGVIVGSRIGGPVDNWAGDSGTFQEAAADADLVVLAIKGAAAEKVVASIASQLAGKTVIDTTNPISEAAPDEGVLAYFTSLDESLMERLQLAVPEANFVKAFNSVGAAAMVNPDFPEKPTMFICGDSTEAKQEVTEILDVFGWETEDMGGAKSARAIEPLCMLWCIPGMLHNQWSHAFKLLKH